MVISFCKTPIILTFQENPEKFKRYNIFSPGENVSFFLKQLLVFCCYVYQYSSDEESPYIVLTWNNCYKCYVSEGF